MIKTTGTVTTLQLSSVDPHKGKKNEEWNFQGSFLCG